MKLFILRHGETEWNKLRKLQGHTDIPINEEGIRLAKLTGEGMKNVQIDMVISSPLQRAIQTAKYVIGNRDIPFITDDRIEEIAFGEWEGEDAFSSTVIPDGYMDKFFNNPLECVRAPKGENILDVCKRTKDFFDEIANDEKYKDKNILISSHGAATRCMLCNFYEDKNDIWRGGVPANCSITIVNVTDGIGVVEEKDKLFWK